VSVVIVMTLFVEIFKKCRPSGARISFSFPRAHALG